MQKNAEKIFNRVPRWIYLILVPHANEIEISNALKHLFALENDCLDKNKAFLRVFNCLEEFLKK